MRVATWPLVLAWVTSGLGWVDAGQSLPDFSKPLSLAQCLNVALQNHPSIKAAAAGVDSARSRVTETKASLFPRLALDSNWSRFQSSRQGYAIGRAGARENRETSVSASYLFLDSGQRTTAIRAAAATADSTLAGLTVTQRNTAMAVIRAYYDLLTAQRLKTLREKVVASSEQHVAAAQAGFEAGTSARIDILRAQTELANAKVDLVAADGDIRRARATLRNAMGLSKPVSIQVQETTPLKAPSLTLAAARNEALVKRPELRQYEASVRAARESLHTARINARPVLSFSGNLDKYLDSTRDVTREWLLRATVTYPLFDARRTRARVQAAAAEVEVRRQQEEQERQSVLLEVEQAWIALQDARARIEAADAARKQADENLALNEASYREGVATMVEVIDARAAAAQAETNQIQARYDFDLAVLQLRYALGRRLLGR